jgi:hypothetical protein
VNYWYQKGVQRLHGEVMSLCRAVMQALPMQPGMQGMQPMLPPYAMELANTASAAGYWADQLNAEEQQRSYLIMQQVQGAALNVSH